MGTGQAEACSSCKFRGSLLRARTTNNVAVIIRDVDVITYMSLTSDGLTAGHIGGEALRNIYPEVAAKLENCPGSGVPTVISQPKSGWHGLLGKLGFTEGVIIEGCGAVTEQDLLTVAENQINAHTDDAWQE